MTALSLTVNGEPVESRSDTLIGLIDKRGIDPARRFLAIAVNGAVVPRAHWTQLRLHDGDAIEIVQPMQGG